MLAEPLAGIAALDIVEAAGVSSVVSGKDPPLGVDLEAEGVASALREDLVASRLGMVAPDELAHGVERWFVAAEASDRPRNGAALRAVEPAVRPPTQMAGDGVRILDAEPLEQDLRIAVGHVVPVTIGIEEEVGRVEDEHAATSAGERRRDRQAVDERAVTVVHAVTVGVLVERDAIPARHVPRRRLRRAVVHGPQKRIPTHGGETGGVRILAVVHHPEPAPLVEVEEEGLADLRLGEHGLDDEVVRHVEPRERLGHRQRALLPRQAAQRPFDVGRRLDLRECGGSGGKRGGVGLPSPVGIVRRQRQPCAGEHDPLVPGQDRRRSHVEAAATVPCVDAYRHDVGRSPAQHRRVDPVPVGSTEAAAKPRRETAGDADRTAIDDDLPGVVDRLEKKRDLPAPPRLRNLDDAPVPHESTRAGGRLLPDLRNSDLPRLGRRGHRDAHPRDDGDAWASHDRHDAQPRDEPTAPMRPDAAHDDAPEPARATGEGSPIRRAAPGSTPRDDRLRPSATRRRKPPKSSSNE